jgi:hypothetical protein
MKTYPPNGFRAYCNVLEPVVPMPWRTIAG